MAGNEHWPVRNRPRKHSDRSHHNDWRPVHDYRTWSNDDSQLRRRHRSQPEDTEYRNHTNQSLHDRLRSTVTIRVEHL